MGCWVYLHELCKKDEWGAGWSRASIGRHEREEEVE